MGAFGYADDVILIAPTKRSMNVLLDICTDFSRDLQVKFNPNKSKLIAYPKSNSDHDLSITFDGQRVYAKSHDIHIGHIIGDNVSEPTITGARNEFIKKVNVLISYFNSTYIETKYKLFKVYCMSLYGSVLWDFSSSYVNVFNTAWRKCIRRLYALPTRTHNALLPGICYDIRLQGNCISDFLIS